MTTFYDLALRSNAEVWRSIRGRRANPPVPPGSEHRRATFQSALEQAEQQFRAAALIDFDSRALNLFYGLSQAGRALAAASATLANGDWRLNGHGLKVPSLKTVNSNIAEIVVKTDGKQDSSFRRLSTIFGSDQPEAVNLGDLWPLIYDTSFGPRLTETIYLPLNVTLESSVARFATSNFQGASVDLPPSLTNTPTADRPALAAYLERYPSLTGWVTAFSTGAQQDWPNPHNALTLQWGTPDGMTTGHVLDQRLTTYRGNTLAYPTIGDAAASVHPLMAWWMALFSLSMLTRYQPDVWTEMIDVNRSPQATAIEFVLEKALDAVPDLIDEAIDQVHQP